MQKLEYAFDVTNTKKEKKKQREMEVLMKI